MKNNLDKVLKLNLGCGLTAPEGWFNIDASLTAKLSKIRWLYRFLCKIFRIEEISWPSNIKIINVAKGLPFKDNTVESIFCSHMLEHLSLKDSNFVILECFRVLRPGGVLRIIVPDLYQLAREYVENMEGKSGVENSHNFLHNLCILETEPGGVRGDFFRKICGHHRHLFMYDRWSLKDLLEKCGLSEIEEKKFGQSRIADIKLVENEGRHKMSVCLEGVKD